MPEPLCMPTGLLLGLSMGEVAEATFEIGQHPAMQGAERRVDPLCNLDAQLEILTSTEIAREPPRDTSGCERTRLQLLQLERLGVDQCLCRDRDRPLMFGGQTEEEREASTSTSTFACERSRFSLDERQRAVRMLEHDIQRFAALMREISQEPNTRTSVCSWATASRKRRQAANAAWRWSPCTCAGVPSPTASAGWPRSRRHRRAPTRPRARLERVSEATAAPSVSRIPPAP